MNLHRYQTAGPFLELAQPVLEAQEVTNNLLLGVTIRLHERPDWIDTPPYLGIVTHQDQVMLMAAITPPHNLLLAASPQADERLEAAMAPLMENLRSEGWQVPGVIAESRLAQRYAQAWQQATGAAFDTRTRLRAYELRQVVPPNPPAAGYLRPAGLDELELMTRWRADFTRESVREEPAHNLDEHIARLIQAGTLYVWDDQGPVSTAAATRPTPHGISIGAVYTPPELRARGYASACVAALSQRQLDTGREFCSLFTDLDYPTSNSVYMRIGYVPVCDFTESAFA